MSSESSSAEISVIESKTSPLTPNGESEVEVNGSNGSMSVVVLK